MELDMGEEKLHAHLLCRTSGCQAKKSYILGNSDFFASPGARVPSNNHTKRVGVINLL
jgi:hypothetical protein